MKLWEVYSSLDEIDATPVEPIKHGPEVDMEAHIREIYGDHLKQLGEGSFAAVFDVPNLTGTVLKKGHVYLGKRTWANPDGMYYDDSYVNYILAIQRHTGFPHSLGNPYFPQIHRIDFYESEAKEGVYKFTAAIEELKELPRGYLGGESVKPDEIKQFMENNPQHLHTQIIRAMRRISDFSLFELAENTAYDGKVDIQELCEVFFKSLIGTNYSGTIAVEPTNDTLKQALILLRRWRKADVGEWDIHSGNIMYRPTPYGIQFVFTDPFA